MTPSLPIPTDNIYKFACLFGLALIIVSIFSFVSVYNASLDRRIKYAEVVISLEAKELRNKGEENILALNKKLIDVSKVNENFANSVIGSVLAVGILLSFFGARQWYQKIQHRDDILAQLQLEKLEVEIQKIRMELGKEKSEPTVTLIMSDIEPHKD